MCVQVCVCGLCRIQNLALQKKRVKKGGHAELSVANIWIFTLSKICIHTETPCLVLESYSAAVAQVHCTASLFSVRCYRAESTMSNTLLMISKLSPRDMTGYENCRTQRDPSSLLSSQINSSACKTIILLKEDKKIYF